MIELYGTPKLRPTTSGPPYRTKIFLDATTTLYTFHVSTPNSGNTAQVLTGEITGPAETYSSLKAVADVPAGFTGPIGGATGRVSGPLITQNSNWILGDLPYVTATPADKVPGSVAVAPGIVLGSLLQPGVWYYPKHAFLQESFARPIATQLMYSEAKPDTPGDTRWHGSSYVHGRFVLQDLNAEVSDQTHQFWAGIALGVGGASLLAALQSFGMLAIPRRAKAR